jgi:hypothetical protein
VPVLDAKALDTDPEGMAFLRAVIRPNCKREEASASPRKEPRPFDTLAQGEARRERRSGPKRRAPCPSERPSLAKISQA